MQSSHVRVLLVALGLVAAQISTPAPAGQTAPEPRPSSVDLRPAFQAFHLTPRRQGDRPTCSTFTVVGALEFAAAKRQGHGTRLSVEFLNWAANQARFNPAQPPSAGAFADAKTRLTLGLRRHWIKEWNVHTGLTDEHLRAIKPQNYMNDAVWVDSPHEPRHGGPQATQPNILFIMTDDHAAHALSCYGSKVNRTPNLDRLAQGGRRFNHAFVPNSICTPSRASIMTGQYSHLNGVPVFNRFEGAKPNVAKLLQAAGYTTAIVGKWHLGSDPTGFDQWIVLPGQGVYNDPFFLTPAGRLKIDGYATDVITDLGLEFLQHRPKDKPFFLMLHHKAPHREWTPDPKNRALFKNRVIPEPPTLFDDYATRPAALPENAQTVARDLTRRDLKLEPSADLKPAERQKWLAVKPMEVEVTQPDGTQRVMTGESLVKWKYQRYMQDYLACVQSVDDNTGRLLDYLDQSGLATNTVVFYTSDNGFYLGDQGMYDKRFMYEPGLRIPLLVRWPGAIPAGSTSDRFALNVDFAPTFLELAGAPVPPDMQGRSLVPLLKGAPPTDWREAIYYRYYHDPGHHNTRAHLGLRTATHKLIHYWKQDAWELYDLAADPLEQKNLAADPAHHAQLEKLKTQLALLKRELKDDDQFATELPKDGVDANFVDHGQLGLKTVAEAIANSRAQPAAP